MLCTRAGSGAIRRSVKKLCNAKGIYRHNLKNTRLINAESGTIEYSDKK